MFILTVFEILVFEGRLVLGHVQRVPGTKRFKQGFMDLNEDVETINKKEKDNDKTLTIKKYNRSNSIYDSKHNFNKNNDIKKFESLSFKSRYS